MVHMQLPRCARARACLSVLLVFCREAFCDSHGAGRGAGDGGMRPEAATRHVCGEGAFYDFHDASPSPCGRDRIIEGAGDVRGRVQVKGKRDGTMFHAIPGMLPLYEGHLCTKYARATGRSTRNYPPVCAWLYIRMTAIFLLSLNSPSLEMA